MLFTDRRGNALRRRGGRSGAYAAAPLPARPHGAGSRASPSSRPDGCRPAWGLRRVSPRRGRRLRRLCLGTDRARRRRHGAYRRSSTSRMPFSAAPTGCSPSAPGGSRPLSTRVAGSAAQGSSTRWCEPACRCARPSPGCATVAISLPKPSARSSLLVLGGSQGARVFGEVIPAAIDRLTARCAQPAGDNPTVPARGARRGRGRLSPNRHSRRARRPSSTMCRSGWRRRTS